MVKRFSCHYEIARDESRDMLYDIKNHALRTCKRRTWYSVFRRNSVISEPLKDRIMTFQNDCSSNKRDRAAMAQK
jgi:hypothetical protein